MSILTDTKAVLGLDEEYTAFDTDVMLWINSAFSTLNQLGVGPEVGFSISDESKTWTDFVPEGPMLHHIKAYVYLVARSNFDPPSTGFLVTATKEQKAELEWRISAAREETQWTPPVVPVVVVEGVEF